MRSDIEETLTNHIWLAGLPEPQREYRFHAKRRWRFDFAWPKLHIAAECEGGTWQQGRHTRGAGFELDCEKYNAATLDGWRVLRFTSEQVKSGYALQCLEKIFEDVNNE